MITIFLWGEKQNYANAFDLFIRTEEICSGAQRVHDVALLEQRARERGVTISSIQVQIFSFPSFAVVNAHLLLGV